MATIPTIADAVHSAIDANAGELPLSFSSARSYLPKYKLAELASALRVTVKPAGEKRERLTRGSRRSDVYIEIAVQKKVTNASDNDELDPLMNFADDLSELLFSHVDTAAGAQLSEVDFSDPTPDDELLNDHNVFTAVMRATYVRLG